MEMSHTMEIIFHIVDVQPSLCSSTVVIAWLQTVERYSFFDQFPTVSGQHDPGFGSSQLFKQIPAIQNYLLRWVLSITQISQHFNPSPLLTNLTGRSNHGSSCFAPEIGCHTHFLVDTEPWTLLGIPESYRYRSPDLT